MGNSEFPLQTLFEIARICRNRNRLHDGFERCRVNRQRDSCSQQYFTESHAWFAGVAGTVASVGVGL
jgi:hypothetical protein